MDDKELLKHTGYIYTPRVRNENAYVPKRLARVSPASYDWRNVTNVVRPVQDQGGCGSCWAFASIASVEGQMAIKKKSYEKLSEQEIIECATYDGILRGCNGGWEFLTYFHAQVNKGVTAATNDPYVATTTDRTCNLTRPRVSSATVASWTYVAANETVIKDTLVATGPLYVTFYVSNDFYSYQSGVFTDNNNSCGTNWANHAVLLVGYGNLNGVDFWLLKNSWGSWWGEQGYFKLKRGSNLCRINGGAAFPTLA